MGLMVHRGPWRLVHMGPKRATRLHLHSNLALDDMRPTAAHLHTAPRIVLLHLSLPTEGAHMRQVTALQLHK
jgi:hypothetical protein